MTHGYGASAQPSRFSDKVLENHEAEDCLIPMGITSENVAKEFNITREAQDAFAAESFRRAAAAQKSGKFVSEIIPVTVKQINPKTEEEFEVVVDADDGIRDGVTAASLAKLKPAFAKDGSTHAGNASQVSDGAAAVLLARRSVAKRLGLPILGKFVTAAVVGVPPRIMGVGPAFAIPKVLSKVGLSKDDIDFYEINEAFASQAVFSVQHIGIPFEKVNPRGGAIAMGHPLGCSASILMPSMPCFHSLICFSWITSDCYCVSYCERNWREDICHKYVHWIWDGNGCDLHERAVVEFVPITVFLSDDPIHVKKDKLLAENFSLE